MAAHEAERVARRKMRAALGDLADKDLAPRAAAAARALLAPPRTGTPCAALVGAMREVAASLADVGSATGSHALACAERMRLFAFAARENGFVASAPALGGAMTAVRRALASADPKIVAAAGELTAALCAAAVAAASGTDTSARAWAPAGAPPAWISELMLGGCLKVLASGDRGKHAAAARVAATALKACNVLQCAAARAAIAATWRELCGVLDTDSLKPSLGEVYLPLEVCVTLMATHSASGVDDAEGDALLLVYPTGAEVKVSARAALETLRVGNWHAKVMAADFLGALVRTVGAAQGVTADSHEALAADALASCKQAIAEGLAMAKYDKIGNVRRAASNAMDNLAATSPIAAGSQSDAIPIGATPVMHEVVEARHRAARRARSTHRPAHIVRAEHMERQQHIAKQHREALRRSEEREHALEAMRRMRAAGARFEPTIEVLALTPPPNSSTESVEHDPFAAVTGAPDDLDLLDAQVDAAVERAAAEAADIVRNITSGALVPENTSGHGGATSGTALAVAAEFDAVDTPSATPAMSVSEPVEQACLKDSDVVPDSDGGDSGPHDSGAQSTSSGAQGRPSPAMPTASEEAESPFPAQAAQSLGEAEQPVAMQSNPAFEEDPGLNQDDEAPVDSKSPGAYSGAALGDHLERIDPAADEGPVASHANPPQGSDDLGFLVESLASVRRSQIIARRRALADAEERRLRSAAAAKITAINAQMERDVASARATHEKEIEADFDMFVASVLPRVRAMLDATDASNSVAARLKSVATSPLSAPRATDADVQAEAPEDADNALAAPAQATPDSAAQASSDASDFKMSSLQSTPSNPQVTTDAPGASTSLSDISDTDFMHKLRDVLRGPGSTIPASSIGSPTEQAQSSSVVGVPAASPSDEAVGEAGASPPPALAWTVPIGPEPSLGAASAVGAAAQQAPSPSVGGAQSTHRAAGAQAPSPGSEVKASSQRSLSLRAHSLGGGATAQPMDSPRAWFGSVPQQRAFGSPAVRSPVATSPDAASPAASSSPAPGSPPNGQDSGSSTPTTRKDGQLGEEGGSAPDLDRVSTILSSMPATAADNAAYGGVKDDGGDDGDGGGQTTPERAISASETPLTPDETVEAMLMGMLADAQTYI